MLRLCTFISCLFLLGCQTHVPLAQKTNVETNHPFIGCWQDEMGLAREGWTIDPSGWLIGYSANRTDTGDVSFFEHMRVERGEGADVLVVTGQEGSQTRFTRMPTPNPSEFRFENLSHDFPQLIVYERTGDYLNAYISLSDGSQRINFDKRSCDVTHTP